MAVVLSVPALLFPRAVAELLGTPAMAPYLWLLPLGVALAGLYSALQYWSSRQSRFPLVAKSRIVQASAGIGAQLGFGILSITPFGLLLGHMLHQGAGSLGLGLSTWRSERKLLGHVTLNRLIDRLKEYRRFPTYSTVEALANSAGVQLPLLLIAGLALGSEAGFVLLATKVLAVPMQLVGRAISQAYLAQAPEQLRAGHLYPFTVAIMKRLAFYGMPALLTAGLIAPSLSVIFFGPEWDRVGILISWMTPWFMLQLLASPLSMILHVTGRQRSAMVLQLMGVGLRAGVVLVVGLTATAWISEAYAVASALFYALYLLVIGRTLLVCRKNETPASMVR
jgi:O-antigen/teichoic acid export membrane protein